MIQKMKNSTFDIQKFHSHIRHSHIRHFILCVAVILSFSKMN